ncbi:MAG: hypothetical protein K9H49_19030 [Bacteroidales bacterium]|nr:hypothetical protein [Bacteroidales bacterium]
MNLIEFIKHLKNKTTEQFMNQHYSDIDYYDAEVYLKGSLCLDSELVIFDGEKIEGLIEMEVNNEKYYNLFTLDLLVEVFADYSNPSSSDSEIAEKIINYRINDA